MTAMSIGHVLSDAESPPVVGLVEDARERTTSISSLASNAETANSTILRSKRKSKSVCIFRRIKVKQTMNLKRLQ